ncbi:MAG: YARHG domain-containing protein [Pseudomonadota bacterium]
MRRTPTKRSRLSKICGLLLLGMLWAVPATAQNFSAWSCGDLWYERNAVFADWNYCFQSQRGINTFGNVGCYRSSQEALNAMGSDTRRYIERIRSEERRRGC